ncbi:TRAP transporter small permease [Desulfovibrio sp. OttesenSCG-928-I05]|nr:TRAP transporter small permease [Desulfovibrio sp. OttesenSCG-928-I05]
MERKRWTLSSFLDNFELLLCSVMLCSMIGLQFIQVIARYGVGRSIGWAEELSRFALLGLVYISGAIGARYNTHIRVTAHIKKFPKPVQFAFGVAATLVWLAFNIIVVYYSVKYIQMMARRPQISGALLIDMRYIFALIPFGFGLQTLRILQLWYNMIKSRDFSPLFYSGED